ncbi:hypothetical protein EJB05_46561, partial [Eragrostis curvula]
MKFSISDITLGISSSSPIIYGPTDLEDTFLIHEDLEDEIQPVFAKITELYATPEVAAYSDGFCFGLLDPISNIVVNNSVVSAGGGEEGDLEDMAVRSLGGLLAFLTYLFPYLPVVEAARYLDAAGADAMVACHLIVQRRGMDEFNPCSETAVAAFEAALRCAAAAVQHPDPQQLVLVWKRLSRNLHLEQSSSNKRDLTMAALLEMIKYNGAGTCTDDDSGGGLAMEKPWDLARRRFDNTLVIDKALPPVRGAMKRMLLATIHGFYLQALAMLPTDELRTRLHRSLLIGGYCYGPLDPVSNIIVNTLWYEHSFPMTSSEQVTLLHMISSTTQGLWRFINTLWYEQRFPPTTTQDPMTTLQMISTECLWRAAARSMYGLVSFLCTRYPGLTPDLALQRLLVAKADLRAADPNLQPPAERERNNIVPPDLGQLQCGAVVELSSPSASVEEAYAAAATAAFHPDPDAQQELLGSQKSMHALGVASEVLRDAPVISAKDIEFLSQLLIRCSRPSSIRKNNNQQQEQAGEACGKKRFSRFMSDCTVRYREKHDRVCDKVKTALDAFNEGQEFKYNVHVICGVNEFVSGPDFSLDPEVRGYNPWTPFKYHHSHINFLATCAGSKPTLFFVECGNHETDKSWCIPVEPPRPLAEHVRCIYCECEGNRIVHPAVKGFHGRDIEFEKLLHGEALFKGTDKDNYSNDKIITRNPVDWVHSVRDEYIYSFNHVDAPSDSDDDSAKEDTLSYMG